MKLDRFEVFTIIVCIWLSSFLTAWMNTQDPARALGNSVWMLLLGWAVVGTINSRRKKKALPDPTND